MNKQAQYNQAPGSNIQTSEQVGGQNQPLNQSAASSGVEPKEAYDLLSKIVSSNSPEENKTEVDDILRRMTNVQISQEFQKLRASMDYTKDPAKRTKDPQTDTYEKTYKDIAKDIQKILAPMLNKTVNNMSAKASFNYKLSQSVTKKKKKTRGNPFRVLMGKVGKLLDHGIEKNDIARYLGKLKYWNKETIERAVDIVRDYNRKKKHDSGKVKEEKKASSESKTVTAGLDYDRMPEFYKESTATLIMRACFLLDLQENNKSTIQGFVKPADTKTAKEQLKGIKQALVARGFDKDELMKLGLGQ